MEMLNISDLHASYGRIEALHGISLSVNQGQIVTIIGSNGAGKSTLLNCISGLINWKGSIKFEGKELSNKSHKVVRTGIVQVPEGRRIFAGLSVYDNLLAGSYLNTNGREVERLLQEQFELFPILKERSKQDAGTLSGGEQQMLAIARGMMSKPKLLLLDEPSLGLAPKIVDTVFNTIKTIRDNGVTILVVEQNANKSLSICDQGYVIEDGRIIMKGTGKELLSNPQVTEAYLGSKRKN